MKTAPTALVTYLNALRGQLDVTFSTAECFLFTLSTGLVLAWTNTDYAVTYNGLTFSNTGPLVRGLKYKATVGLEVDKQQIAIAARPTDLISTVGVLQSIAEGAFDGAVVERHRVFVSAPAGSVIGGAMLFHGHVSTVDTVGRTRAQITVASDLIILDNDMPRNLFQPTCLHTLYDSGCGIARGVYSVSGPVRAGSTSTVINFSGALAAHAQGSIVFSTGANANLRATVKQSVPGSYLQLMYPLPSPPAIGDNLTVSQGCDHTPNTCKSRFNNLSNFRGFPYVPPPQIAW